MSEQNQYTSFFVLHEAIRQSRYNALKTVNAELVNLYWQVGAFVSKQLAKSEWGEKTVQQLSEFLQKQEPGLKGFDQRSIYRMIQFYETYSSDAIVVPVEPQLETIDNQLTKIVGPVEPQFELAIVLRKQIFGESVRNTVLVKLNWTNNLIIFSRCKTAEEREFYIRMSIKERYSKRELERQISASLFERTMLSKTQLKHNIKNIETANSIIDNFKDSYVFEFLNLPDPHSESDLQKELIAQMKKFILELGKDFLFIGEEYKLLVGNRDFFIDMLFYHRGLQCLVAFELKNEKFEPEHLGKINFYLEALDRDVKKENENPSIGVLLCKDKDSEVVEYALSRSLSPTMVSEYKTQLPDKKLLKQKLHELFSDEHLIQASEK